MLSRPRAALQLGAILALLLAVAAGVLFALDGGSDATEQLQAPPATETAATPAATPLPDLVFEQTDIDTSNWVTYESPLGFSIKYPPEWKLDEADPSTGVALGTARITMRQPEGTRIVIEGGGAFLPPGVMHDWLEISPVEGTAVYPLEERFTGCITEPPDPARPERIRQGSTGLVLGRTAGRCFTQGLDRTGGHLGTAYAHTIALSDDLALSLVFNVWDADEAMFDLTEAMLGTLYFEEPAIDISGWLTYESPLGYSIRYPPDWTISGSDPLRIMNPGWATAVQKAMEQGRGALSYVDGMASVYIDVQSSSSYAEAALGELCRARGQERSTKMLAGRTAVTCLMVPALRSESRALTGLSYGVEFPAGRTSVIEWSTTSPSADMTNTLEAIVASLTFAEAN